MPPLRQTRQTAHSTRTTRSNTPHLADFTSKRADEHIQGFSETLLPSCEPNERFGRGGGGDEVIEAGGSEKRDGSLGGAAIDAFSPAAARAHDEVATIDPRQLSLPRPSTSAAFPRPGSRQHLSPHPAPSSSGSGITYVDIPPSRDSDRAAPDSAAAFPPAAQAQTAAAFASLTNFEPGRLAQRFSFNHAAGAASSRGVSPFFPDFLAGPSHASLENRPRLPQPASNLKSAPLLEAFLAADRAVKENQPTRTRSRVEDWVESLGKTDSRGAGEGTEKDEHDERGMLSEDERDEQDNDDALPDPKQQRQPSGRLKPARSSPPAASSAALTSSPAPSPTRKKPRVPSQPKPSKPCAPSHRRTRPNPTLDDAALSSSPPLVGSSADPPMPDSGTRLKTADLVAMLPRRRKLRAVEAEEEGTDEGDETDYELFSSPRRSGTQGKPKPSRGFYTGRRKRARGAKGRKSKAVEAEEEADESASEKERRKTAARTKWAAVDGFELETELTL
ncbi:hypothetical protein JCM10207_007690 [Rhodosporidiobolus poonsookiae]